MSNSVDFIILLILHLRWKFFCIKIAFLFEGWNILVSIWPSGISVAALGILLICKHYGIIMGMPRLITCYFRLGALGKWDFAWPGNREPISAVLQGWVTTWTTGKSPPCGRCYKDGGREPMPTSAWVSEAVRGDSSCSWEEKIPWDPVLLSSTTGST